MKYILIIMLSSSAAVINTCMILPHPDPEIDDLLLMYVESTVMTVSWLSGL